MSEKSQKKPSTKKATPTTSVHQEQDEAQHLLGNSFLNTQLQNAGQKADDVINDLISEKSIQKYARSIVDSAAGSLKNFLKSNVDAQDHDAASMFSNAIRGEMRNYSDAIMMDAGVAQKISGFLSENKFLVITAALGAAVKYVLDNEKLPELKKEFELGGGHSISTSIDIGTTLDIAVREIELGYRYSADRFRASFGAQHSLETGNFGLQSELGYNIGENMQIRGKGRYEDSGAWESSIGIGGGKDNFSWGAEAFSARDKFGRQDSGGRLNFKWKF